MRDGYFGDPAEPVYRSRRERRAAERAAESASPSHDVLPPAEPVAVVAKEAAALAETAPFVPDFAVLAAELTRSPAGETAEVRAEAAEPPVTEPEHVAPRKASRVKAPKAPRIARPAKAKAAKRSRPGLTRSLMSATCMAFAVALAIGMTVPTNLFGSAAPVVASELPEAEAVVASKQALAVDDTVVAAESVAERDGFGGQTFASVEQARYQASGQGFAPGFVPTAGAIRWPFDHSVPLSSGFGYSDPNYLGGSFHTGLDFVPGEGAPVSAIAAGVVTWVGWDNTGRGYNVVIQHNVGGIKTESIYGHMIDGSSTLYPGQTIDVGTVVGLTGDTGWAYGAHLHLAIVVQGEFVDPYVWLTEHATDAW